MSIIQISNFIPCFTKENLFLFTFVVLVGLFETWHFLTTINSLFDCISFSLFSFYYSLSCFVFLDFDTKISLVWTATISEKINILICVMESWCLWQWICLSELQRICSLFSFLLFGFFDFVRSCFNWLYAYFSFGR